MSPLSRWNHGLPGERNQPPRRKFAQPRTSQGSSVFTSALQSCGVRNKDICHYRPFQTQLFAAPLAAMRVFPRAFDDISSAIGQNLGDRQSPQRGAAIVGHQKQKSARVFQDGWRSAGRGRGETRGWLDAGAEPRRYVAARAGPRLAGPARWKTSGRPGAAGGVTRPADPFRERSDGALRSPR